MNTNFRNLLIACCFSLPYLLTGQSEGRKLLAHYPMTEHFRDVTGLEDTLETANVLLTADGTFIDGGNPFADTANQIKVSIEDLNLDDFYIELEVKLDSISADSDNPLTRNIFVGGTGWRWMQVSLNQSIDTISLRTNNGDRSQNSFNYRFDTWYTIGISYNRSNQTANLYIDDFLVSSDTVDLNTSQDKSLAVNCLCGPWPMKGFWKNLMVYGQDNRSIPVALSCSENQLPTDESAMDGSIAVAIDGGVLPYSLSWNGGDTTFTQIGTYVIPNLGLGTYQFELLDSIGVRQTCESTLQIAGQLPLIAHYPMQGDLKDRLELNNDLIIEHVDIRDSALYIDGAENFTDTSNLIQLNRINDLNHDEFEIQLEFNLDSLLVDSVGQQRTIILAGQSFRWATLVYHNDTKELRLGYNNLVTSNQRIPFEFNQWYKMSITYDRKVRALALWLDGEKVDEVETDLIANLDRSIALNCCGRPPMKGLWRNLKVYSTKINVIPDLTLRAQTTEWTGGADAADGAVRIAIEGGSMPFTAKLFSDSELVDSQQVFGREVAYENLSAGSFLVEIEDASDSTQAIAFDVFPPQTELPIMSYYPLDLSLNDTAGIHRGMTLTNVEHIFQEGLSIPGNNNSGNADIDQIATTFPSMDRDDFYISLNVTIDSIENLIGDLRSIFVLGSSVRWMYPYYSVSSQQIHLAYNNERHPEAGGFTFEYGREYELAISYNSSTRTGKLFMDRQEVIRDTFDLETSGDVSFVLNCSCGPRPMKGFWRDMRVYSAGPMTTSSELSDKGKEIRVYPNPTTSHITIESSDPFNARTPIIFYTVLGKEVYRAQIDESQSLFRLNVSSLPAGTYWMRIGGYSEKFIKL